MRLEVAAPLHLEATVRILQRRASNLVDTWEDSCYRRAVVTSGGLVLAQVCNQGAVDAPELRVVVHSESATGAANPQVAQKLRRLLGLDVDPVSYTHLTLPTSDLV